MNDADELKKLGNDFYKKGLYRRALECYKEAIEIQPREKTYYSNQALALIKLEKYHEALKNCQKIINIDSQWFKGYHLQGLCLFHLEKFIEAKKSFSKLLLLQPKNKNSRQKLIDISQIPRKLDSLTTKRSKRRKKLKKKAIEKVSKKNSSAQRKISKLQNVDTQILTQLEESRKECANWKLKHNILNKSKKKEMKERCLTENNSRIKIMKNESLKLNSEIRSFIPKKIEEWTNKDLFQEEEVRIQQLQSLQWEIRRRLNGKKYEESI